MIDDDGVAVDVRDAPNDVVADVVGSAVSDGVAVMSGVAGSQLAEVGASATPRKSVPAAGRASTVDTPDEVA